ncbi:MAG: CvpA family protein, partial [Planctomycetota bacterium]
MAADIIFVVFVLYGFIFGLRRGFYKELIAFVALVVAVGAARTWKDPVGRLLQAKATFLGTGTAHALGAVVVWVVTFFLVVLIGRLILKKIRNPDAENNLEKAADGVADAAEGDTKMGPVTLLTNPVAKAHKSVV